MTGNYLRVRGEYLLAIVSVVVVRELPPRARRIHTHKRTANSPQGTTSACAENTIRSITPLRPDRNYLRVRGEYSFFVTHVGEIGELPPRARRIHRKAIEALQTTGTTSACAENTWLGRVFSTEKRNYLRVRGEYLQNQADESGKKELPPRARRIQSTMR